VSGRPRRTLECKQCGAAFSPQRHRNKYCSFACANIARRVDLVGRRFERLVVVEFAGRTAARASKYRCACDCGRTSIVLSHKLVSGHTRSCGCLAADALALAGKRRRRHGHSSGNSPTYRSWTSMIRRCTAPLDKMYPAYGARGITVCERWRVFENFLADMGERPAGTSIDRFPNGNGGYEPGNCRWGTTHEQAQNSRIAKLSSEIVRSIRSKRASGISATEIANELGVSAATVYRVVRRETWSNIQ
jgi:hypothetical protein